MSDEGRALPPAPLMAAPAPDAGPAGSPALAAWIGLRRGDMIVAVNRTPVSSVADLRGMLAGHRAVAALELIRDGSRLFIVAR